MEELELIIGAHVYFRDGKCGRLSKVIVDPAAWRVTHIIVEDGFLQRRLRIYPIAAVAQAAIGDIFLTLAEDELDAYPEYSEELSVVQLPEGATVAQRDDASDGPFPLSTPQVMVEKRRPAGSPDLLIIERGTPVVHRDESLGRLDHFLARPGDGQIKGLVMQQPAIPHSMVRRIDAHLISLGEEARRLHRT